jgi:hypothetical protein
MLFPLTRVTLFIDIVKKAFLMLYPEALESYSVRHPPSIDLKSLRGNPRLGSIGNQYELQRPVDAMFTGAPLAILTPNKMILNRAALSVIGA